MKAQDANVTKDDKANILVLGTSGAGKSTLINTVIGRDVAKVGSGKHITKDMQTYESEDLNFRLIDSRGFEYSFLGNQKAVKDMKGWMKSGLKGDKPRIHMLWFCVDATSKRFTKTTFRTVEQVKKEWEDIPIIVVLTKSFFPAEDAENIEMVKETFQKVAKRTGMPVAIIPVLSRPPKGIDIVPRGIEELIKTTEEYLNEALKDSDEAVWNFDLKCKRMYAQAVTAAAVTSATFVGAIPIAVPDAALLTPLETGLISGIARIYELDKEDDFTKKLFSRIIEAGTASVIAKAAINKLKLLPGLANVAADVLNAIVAGAIVLSIGEASAIVFEKVYIGDIDKENLDWINVIVNDHVGSVLSRIIEIISKHNNEIHITEIIEELFKKQSKSEE